jgi:hypothetical protein
MAETINYVIQRGDLYTTIRGSRWADLRAWWGDATVRTVSVARRGGNTSKLPAVIFPAILLYLYRFEKEKPRGLVRPLLRSLPSLIVSAAIAAFSASMVAKGFNPGAASGSIATGVASVVVGVSKSERTFIGAVNGVLAQFRRSLAAPLRAHDLEQGGLYDEIEQRC